MQLILGIRNILQVVHVIVCWISVQVVHLPPVLVGWSTKESGCHKSMYKVFAVFNGCLAIACELQTSETDGTSRVSDPSMRADLPHA